MYKHVFESLNRRNISAFAYDHRFHGTSEIFADDLEFILRNSFPQTKYDHIFIMAHSMGSMIAWGLEMTVGLRKVNPRIRGLISLGTCFDIGFIPFVFKIVQPLWASEYTPKFLKSIHLGQQTRGHDDSCRSPHFQGVIDKEDIRKYHLKTMQFCGVYYQYLRMVIWKNYDKVKIPCRFLHGTKDTRCTIFGMLDGYKKMPPKIDKSMKIFKDYFHELLLEDDYEKVLDDACEWMQKRLSPNLEEIKEKLAK